MKVSKYQDKWQKIRKSNPNKETTDTNTITESINNLWEMTCVPGSGKLHSKQTCQSTPGSGLLPLCVCAYFQFQKLYWNTLKKSSVRQELKSWWGCWLNILDQPKVSNAWKPGQALGNSQLAVSQSHWGAGSQAVAQGRNERECSPGQINRERSGWVRNTMGQVDQSPKLAFCLSKTDLPTGVHRPGGREELARGAQTRAAWSRRDPWQVLTMRAHSC